MPQGLPDAAAEKWVDREQVFLAGDVPAPQYRRQPLDLGSELCTRAADRSGAQSCGAQQAADAAEQLELSQARSVLALAALRALPLGPQAALPPALSESVAVLAAQALPLVARARSPPVELQQVTLQA